MKPDLNLLADTTGAPNKIWFEGEQRFELRFPCTLLEARSRLLQGITHKKPVKTGFWEAGFYWEGAIENDNVRFTIAVIAGKGNFTYKVFGKLFENEKGTVVQMIIRDSIALGFILPCAIFLSIIFFSQGSIGIGLFFSVVLGFLLPIFVSNWQSTGRKKATKLISHIISTY